MTLADCWTKDSKEFLKGQGKTVDISQLVKDYKTAISAFHPWMEREIIAVMEPEIRETQKLWEQRVVMRNRLIDESGKKPD